MSSDKSKSEEKSHKDLKVPSLLDQQILATLLQSVNQNASLGNNTNHNQQQQEGEFDENDSNHKEKSQGGEDEEFDDQENSQNQVIQEGQKKLLETFMQQYQLLQQQQIHAQEQTQKQINQRMEEEENDEEDEEENNQDDEQIEENIQQEQNNKVDLNQKVFGNQKQEDIQDFQQDQLLQLIMNLNAQNNPLAQLQQSAQSQNSVSRNSNQLEKNATKANQKIENQDEDENEENYEGDNNIQQQVNISNFDQLRIQRLLQAHAQLQSGEEDEEIEQLRGLQNQQNNKIQGDNIKQLAMQRNQMQAEEDQDEGEEEEEAKQALHKQFLEKQYQAYMRFEYLMNQIKNLEEFLNSNNLTSEKKMFAEQNHQMLVLELKQLQQHIQETGMNPNLVLEQLQMHHMQKQGQFDQENLLNQQKKEFLLRNNAYIHNPAQIPKNIQQIQDQEQAQQQIQYHQYIQQQQQQQPDKNQQNSNYQNHPLVNFFNSYSLFINDTANIQLDQEVVLNKLIENAKKCKPPSNADERVNQLWNYLTDLDKKQIEDFEQQLKSLPEQNIYECIQTIEKLHIKLLVEYNIEVARGKQLGIIKQ